MDLFDVVRSCLRRWYILIPLLAVTGVYCHQVYTSVLPVYYSQTVIGLAYVRPEQSEPGSLFDIKVAGGQIVKGHVVKLPFYDPGNARQEL